MACLTDGLKSTLTPVLTARSVVRSLLQALRERCAPVRDEAIDNLMSALDTTSSAPLNSQVLVDVIKAILQLGELMKEDLLYFVASTWREEDAQRWLREEAKQYERRAILSVWDYADIKESWLEWVRSSQETAATTHHRWISRLIKALGANEPVFPLSSTRSPHPNALPPPFFFSCSELIHVQNLIQALVIAGALCGLVGKHPKQTSTDESFTNRIWILLKSEADADMHAAADITLLHLTDEVVRQWKQDRGGDVDNGTEEQEAQLRQTIARILRYEDPVFSLLQRRILTALESRLLDSLDKEQNRVVPLRIQSGIRAGADQAKGEDDIGNIMIKGASFDHPVLKAAIKHVFKELMTSVQWVADVWGKLLDEE